MYYKVGVLPTFRNKQSLKTNKMKKIILSTIMFICFFANANTSSISKTNQPIDTCCIAGSWGVSHWGLTSVTALIVPAPTTITAGQPIYFNMAYSCDPRCGISTPTFEYKIMDVSCNTVLYTSGAGKPASYNFVVPFLSGSPATVSIQITVKCGSWTCKSICIKQCVYKSCCMGSSWGAMTYTKISTPPSLPVVFKCGSVFSTMHAGNVYTLNVSYNCATGCACTIRYKMDGVYLGVAVPCATNKNITIPPAGGHVLTIEAYCNGLLCNACNYQFKSI